MFNLSDLVPVETKREETLNTLVDFGKRFSEELQCPIEEVNARIRFAKDGLPYYELFRMNGVTKKNEKIRDIHLSDIIIK